MFTYKESWKPCLLNSRFMNIVKSINLNDSLVITSILKWVWASLINCKIVVSNKVSICGEFVNTKFVRINILNFIIKPNLIGLNDRHYFDVTVRTWRTEGIIFHRFRLVCYLVAFGSEIIDYLISRLKAKLDVIIVVSVKTQQVLVVETCSTLFWGQC